MTSIAFPALGTGVGGFPLDEAALVTVKAVREELSQSPTIQHVIFAMRGAAAYQAFESALAATSGASAGSQRGRRVSFPYEPGEEQRDELVEQVAREIQLRGLTGPAVHFLQASRPYRPLGANAMLFFDPGVQGLFGGGFARRDGDPRRRRRDRTAHREARGTRRRRHLGRVTARLPAVAAEARTGQRAQRRSLTGLRARSHRCSRALSQPRPAATNAVLAPTNRRRCSGLTGSMGL